MINYTTKYINILSNEEDTYIEKYLMCLRLSTNNEEWGGTLIFALFELLSNLKD